MFISTTTLCSYNNVEDAQYMECDKYSMSSPNFQYVKEVPKFFGKKTF